MNATPAARLFEEREARLAALDELSRRHWLGGLTHTQGTLDARLKTLVTLRRDLYRAVLPAPEIWEWPAAPMASAFHASMEELGLARFCAGQQELTDTVVSSLLFHLDFIVDYRDRGASPERAACMAVEAFAADWSERCGQLEEWAEVFGWLPDDGKNMNWDQMRGLLRSTGWQEVLRVRRQLEQLPALRKLIRELGRTLPVDRPDQDRQTPVDVEDEVNAFQPERRSVRIPDMPGETRGVHRSDRIARMLPAEAVLLGHPKLRLIWHARRAERTLLCYEDDDRMDEIREQRARVKRPRPDRHPGRRHERGPLLVCVDTSGSMQGGAETVAKAVVLEAMRVAREQRRACHVFSFGGPGEVIEMTLGFDMAGIERLTRFLGQAFRGGTDICGPLEAALAKLEDAAWRQADLLVASDGEFGASPELATRLSAARHTLGLRVQGVLIGDRETVGFLEIADAILPVRDWRKFGGTQGESPIHSHRLTALYFPGALRGEENRAATVSPEVAAGIMLGGKPA